MVLAMSGFPSTLPCLAADWVHGPKTWGFHHPPTCEFRWCSMVIPPSNSLTNVCTSIYIYITYTKRYIYNIYMTYRWCLTYVNLPLHPLMNYKHKLCLTIDFNQWNPNVRIRLLIRTLAILHHCINYPPYQGNKKKWTTILFVPMIS